MGNSKYKVIPGLSVTTGELRKRLTSNSFVLPSLTGGFSLEEGVDKTLRMTRAELFRSHLEGKAKLKDLQAKAAEQKAEAKQKAESKRLEKLKAEARAEIEKDLSQKNPKNNG